MIMLEAIGLERRRMNIKSLYVHSGCMCIKEYHEIQRLYETKISGHCQ